MTLLLRWLLIHIIALIALLFWKGSHIMIKSALLIIPLALIIAWFGHEGAFSGSGGLEKLYGLLALIAFLLCYEIGILFHRFHLIKKNIPTTQDDVLLIIGLILLIVSIIFFLIVLK
ncbi:hypothetical protein [Flavobacterium sp.]|uniref:hypothetical protein n=1 Tax=Flavobacterium sp. TaxID=239 RepID=UPI00374D34E8